MDFVKIFPPKSHGAILEIQRQADVLLLLQWTDSANVGNIPAKLLEQIALRRPVLCIDPKCGIPARILNKRRARVRCQYPISDTQCH